MDNIRGIVLMVAAMGGFALEDMFIKLVSASLPTSQILIMLGAGGTAIFTLWARARGAQLFAPALFTRPMWLRNLGEVFGTVCFVSSITLVPLSTASAILQATPLAVTLGAAVFLGAPVGWRRWSAILVGFAGVLLVVRPGLAGFEPAALLAVAAVFGLAMRDLCTRVAPPAVSSLTLSAYGFAMATLAGVVLLPFGGGPVMPDGTAALALLCGLLVGVAAYYAITAAMRVGEVAVVTPFRYARLIFALILGMAVFGERPDALTLLGAAIIIASGLYTLLREQRLRRVGVPTP
jgi:drug/metabolite transporter (DMT)-like permease